MLALILAPASADSSFEVAADTVTDEELDELEVELQPSGLRWFEETPCWILVRVRESFFAQLVDQAAGMLAGHRSSRVYAERR